MGQPERMAALDAFRKNEVTLLIASDVAARGLDIPAVSHVYNFDVPHHPDDYVHRIGRTGRAGRSGAALTIVSPADAKSIGAIEKLIGQTIPWMDGVAAEPETASAASGATGEQRPSPRREQRGRSNRSRNAPSKGREQAPRLAPHAEAVAPIPMHATGSPKEVARRPEPSRQRDVEPGSDASHLPAFLLRPISIKA